jgi:hypothetical protein
MGSHGLAVHRTDHFASGGKIMTNREREVHPSAQILWDALQTGRFTRMDVVRQLRLNSRQQVSNWLRDGIPNRHIAGVARMCDMEPSEYRARAGLPDTDPGMMTLPADPQIEQLVRHFEVLPPKLQAYILCKVKEIKKYVALFPGYLHDGISPPEDRDKLREWEREFYADIERKIASEEAQAQTDSAHDPETNS